MIHIVLYQPEIPANTGNIMRTAEATGSVLHLIEPLGFYIDDQHLRRSGMDYRNKIELHVHHTWEDFTKEFPGTYYYVSRYGHRSPDQFDFKKEEDLFLIFGKESTGIPLRIMKENLDHQIRIPMVPDARSLNLSNSVAIVLYEALRQKGYPNLAKAEVLKGPDYRGNEE